MLYRSVASEAVFLKALFDNLAQSSIHYAVMRNHETLPDNAGGSDLDILVLSQDEVRIKALLCEAIQDAGGVAIGAAGTAGFFKVCALGSDDQCRGSWWGQCIDVNVGLYFKGQRLLVDDLRWPVVLYRGINVLDDGFSGVLGVLKEVFNNGTFPERYAKSARCGVEQDWASIKILLAPMGTNALERLKGLILSDALGGTRALECWRLRNAFLWHSFATQPWAFVQGWALFEWSKFRRYIKPSGIVVAILGVDGVGKSTIVNALKPVLDDATHNSTVVLHLRPSLLPPLSRLKRKREIPVEPVLDPHGSKPSGALGSLFRLIYLLLDYIIGYWFKIRFKIAKQPTVVIFDRYAYDLALDPYRFRINLPTKLLRWSSFFAPKPDLIFCLHGKPEVLAGRKCELSIDEVTRQVEALKVFAANEPRSVLISTEGTVEETRDHVLSSVHAYCKREAK